MKTSHTSNKQSIQQELSEYFKKIKTKVHALHFLQFLYKEKNVLQILFTIHILFYIYKHIYISIYFLIYSIYTVYILIKAVIQNDAWASHTECSMMEYESICLRLFVFPQQGKAKQSKVTYWGKLTR
jgi:hypothetical protein